MKNKTKQLRILSQKEIEEIYGQPQFTHEDRQHLFALATEEEKAATSLHSVKSRVFFILQLGYFKVRQFFCPLSVEKSKDDLEYIMQRYFPAHGRIDFSMPDQRTLQKHRQLIIQICRFREFDGADRKLLEDLAKQAVKVSSKPIYVFRILMEQLGKMRVVLPSYRYMQDTVSAALTHERKRLGRLLQQTLTAQNIADLKHLIADTGQLHEITQLRKEPKDYSYGQIREEIQRRNDLAQLYAVAALILPRLDVSNETIKYYASLVGYYTVFRLKRLNEHDVQLYLLCFLYHRYQKANDNLIDCLIYLVRQYWDGAKKSAKERMYLSQKESGENIKKAGKALEVFIDDRLDEATPIAEVQEQAYTILERKKLSQAAQHITTGIVTLDETAYQWDYIDGASQQFKKRIRPLIQAIDFAATANSENVLQAVIFLKSAFDRGFTLGRYAMHQFPMHCIQPNTRRYMVGHAIDGSKHIIADRYEFQIYRLLRDNLDAGNISCRESVRHRSLEDDLVDDVTWRNDKAKLIAESGSPILQQPFEEHLTELLELLETRIIQVNARIAAGENKHFKVTRRGRESRWTLQYPRESDPVNHRFYDDLPQGDISRVLHFVNERCGFMGEFEHILGRYTKKEADELLITASLIAWGTNMGLGKMGAISNISYDALDGTSNSFLRPETLKAANDRISDATGELPIFRHYDIGEVLHSSSDGQKIETLWHTIRSRHSSKYFGLGKGLSANTMIINHVPVNAKLLGANDHESHYVYDLIYNNNTDIQPSIHSTDTHGSNQVNFAILHVFGYQFAPRYKDICDTVTNSLYMAPGIPANTVMSG